MSRRSHCATRSPARARYAAATSALCPAPITRTSKLLSGDTSADHACELELAVRALDVGVPGFLQERTDPLELHRDDLDEEPARRTEPLASFRDHAPGELEAIFRVVGERVLR